MACGCSKVKKATGALLSGAASPEPETQSPRTAKRRAAPVARVRQRATFRALPPPGNLGDPEVFSTLYEARRYIDDHPGWTMDIVRVPID